MADTPIDNGELNNITFQSALDLQKYTKKEVFDGIDSLNFKSVGLYIRRDFDQESSLNKFNTFYTNLNFSTKMNIVKKTLKKINKFEMKADLCEDYKKPVLNENKITNDNGNGTGSGVTIYRFVGINPSTMNIESWMSKDINSKKPDGSNQDYLQVALSTD